VSEALVLCGVGVVGAVGAIGRFLLDGTVARRLGREFPYGTLAVNLTGTLALGVLVGATLAGDAYELAGTGLLGAYTTFSTWMLESHRLAEEGELAIAGRNVAISLVLGLVAAFAGRRLGALL
jgi:fluoride exporter